MREENVHITRTKIWCPSLICRCACPDGFLTSANITSRISTLLTFSPEHNPLPNFTSPHALPTKLDSRILAILIHRFARDHPLHQPHSPYTPKTTGLIASSASSIIGLHLTAKTHNTTRPTTRSYFQSFIQTLKIISRSLVYSDGSTCCRHRSIASYFSASRRPARGKRFHFICSSLFEILFTLASPCQRMARVDRAPRPQFTSTRRT